MGLFVMKEFELELNRHLDSIIFKLNKNEFLRFREAVGTWHLRSNVKGQNRFCKTPL